MANVMVNEVDTSSLNAALHNLPTVNVDMERIESIRKATQLLQDEIASKTKTLEKLYEEFQVLYEACKGKIESRIH